MEHPLNQREDQGLDVYHVYSVSAYHTAYIKIIPRKTVQAAAFQPFLCMIYI